jgi:peptide/nickel transport system substrate-binding protein
MKVAVAATAAALFLAACQSGTETPPAEAAGGTLRAGGSEPAGLGPGYDDSPSITIVRTIYAGLIYNDDKDGKVVNEIAQSITSDDNKVWTVKLKNNYKFHNGEPVNADSFINAWNYVAYGPNALPNAPFFHSIVGWDDLQSEDPDGEEGPQKAPEPKAKTMSGLKKIDDFSFTVTLAEAFVGWPATVGYSGFFPMAQACLADFKACNETPIGNGPYKIEGNWRHNVGVTVVKNPDWPGTKGKADKIEFKIYDKIDTGYADFEAGELDIWDGVPPAKYKEAKGKYGERLYEAPSNTFTYVGLPLYNDNFKDVKIRQALSLAIDRQAIIDAVFDGRFSVAEGVISPNFEGFRPGSCANCKYDAAKAKALLAEAGGWKGGKIVLWANAGAGHEKWMQAVGDGWKRDLGIDYELKVDLQFPQYLATADGKKFTGPFRLGWGPDYNFLETYLNPLYSTTGSSNNSGYSNAEFDKLMKDAAAAKSIGDGIKFYQQAEDIVVRDLPVIPMWFGKTANVRSENVKDYVYNRVHGTVYTQITLKDTSAK